MNQTKILISQNCNIDTLFELVFKYVIISSVIQEFLFSYSKTQGFNKSLLSYSIQITGKSRQQEFISLLLKAMAISLNVMTLDQNPDLL